MLKRLGIYITALSLVAAVTLAIALHDTRQDLALSQARATALQGDLDNALGSLARQNQAVARLEEEGKAQAARMAAVVPHVQRRQVETQKTIQSLQAAVVPVDPEPAQRWGAVEARRLALQWEEGARR